jgi:uncharacterized protein (DUF488 family)
MFNRQFVLVNLIRALNEKGIKSRTAIAKGLFLLREEYEANNKLKFYSFYPYKYGPFSGLCFSDLRKLKEEGLVDSTETTLTKKAMELKQNDLMQKEVYQMTSRFENEDSMVKYVYANYPAYTVKSRLIPHEVQTEQQGYFSIGYEGKDIDEFLNKLIQNNVTTLVDVRKNAFSMNFCYIKNKLSKFLEEAGIKYIHFSELGINSEDRKNLKTRKDYDKLFSEYRKNLPTKQEKLNQLIELGKKEKIAFMCFEANHNYCHRGQIADYLEKQNLGVVHL